MTEVNLIGGFYQSKTLPFSAQDLVNWLPVPAKVEGARSPIKLRGLPGLRGFNPPITVIMALTISGDAPNTTVGATYSFSYTAAGGTPPYVFSIVSGTLPAGLSMSSAGVITGTPTTGETRTFTVRVTDADGQTAELEDTITVAVVEQIFWRSSTTGGRVLTHNIALPPETVAGDWLIIFTLCEAVAASTGRFFPSADPFTAISFGGGEVPGFASGAAFITQATASHVSSGYPVSVQDTGTPAASLGGFTVYTLRESIVAPTPIVSGANTSFSFDPPSVSNAFGTSTVINFASVFTRTTATVQTMPYTDGQQTVTVAGTAMSNCYQRAANTGTTNPAAFTFTGTNTNSAVSTNVVEGNP